MTARLAVAVPAAVIAGLPLSLAPFATLSAWMAAALLWFLAVEHYLHPSTTRSAGASLRAGLGCATGRRKARALVSPARPHRGKTPAPVRCGGGAPTEASAGRFPAGRGRLASPQTRAIPSSPWPGWHAPTSARPAAGAARVAPALGTRRALRGRLPDGVRRRAVGHVDHSP